MSRVPVHVHRDPVILRHSLDCYRYSIHPDNAIVCQDIAREYSIPKWTVFLHRIPTNMEIVLQVPFHTSVISSHPLHLIDTTEFEAPSASSLAYS